MFSAKIFDIYVTIVNTFDTEPYASPYEHREVFRYPTGSGYRSTQCFPVFVIPHPFPTSGFMREKTMTMSPNGNGSDALELSTRKNTILKLSSCVPNFIIIHPNRIHNNFGFYIHC